VALSCRIVWPPDDRRETVLGCPTRLAAEFGVFDRIHVSGYHSKYAIVDGCDGRSYSPTLGSMPRCVARFIRYAERMEVYGPDLGMPHTRAMGGGLFELRLKGPEALRVFYGVLNGRQSCLCVTSRRNREDPFEGVGRCP